jgi:hypothetical protein
MIYEWEKRESEKKLKKKSVKRESFELRLGGFLKSEGVERVLVQVKVSNNFGKKKVLFVTIGLNEFIRVINEGKLDEK